MENISQYMKHDHESCDARFVEAEQAAEQRDWARLAAQFAVFDGDAERHFAIEEEILFPKFEDRTGMTSGPTQMMRSEHAQMRDLLSQMRPAVEARNADEYLGLAETLLVLMRQHNLKEEQILYGMIDRAFQGEEQDLIGLMEARKAA